MSNDFTAEDEIAVRKRQVAIMADALNNIRDATDFEGAKLAASIAFLGADFELLKKEQMAR